MPIDYAALQGDGAGTPDDGDHIALLERAVIVDTQNGERLVTEWRAPTDKAAWQSWNRFDVSGMSWTRDLLIGLGVDLKVVTDDDAMSDALNRVVNRYWRVHTTSQTGSQGDRVFVTTYVNGPAGPVEPDVPIDTRDLPEPTAPAPAAPGAQFGDKAPF